MEQELTKLIAAALEAQSMLSVVTAGNTDADRLAEMAEPYRANLEQALAPFVGAERG
jgi:hypothetical protein